MSTDRISPAGTPAIVDRPNGASQSLHALETSIAIELLHLRRGVHPVAGHGRSVAVRAAAIHALKSTVLGPGHELLSALLRRAYSQLLAGDAAAARATLEYALARADAPRPGHLSVVPHTLFAHQPNHAAARAGTDERHVVAPAASIRVVVRALGTFEVRVDGLALPEGKKQPRRTLALLKAIIALGGRDVCRATLADALWPELEGDNAQNALTVTLHRLRGYLGVAGAVTVRHGRLSLEPRHVWVDAFAFEAAARAVNPASGCDSVERAFELYRGPFLAADGDEPWAVRLRERLRSRFVSIVAGAGAALEAGNRMAEAAAVYERGLAADDLVCAFHDGLVRCLCKLGRDSEAETARRRKGLLAPAGLC
jgi:LuxR family maltose regulon positive regulatory protein